MANIKSKIKKGDEIIVISGKDKGKRGIVLKVSRVKDGKVRLLVEGINMVKKHIRPNPNAQQPGGIKEMERYMDIAKVMLFDPTTQKGSRVGYRILEDGRKVRYFKSSGELVASDKV